MAIWIAVAVAAIVIVALFAALLAYIAWNAYKRISGAIGDVWGGLGNTGRTLLLLGVGGAVFAAGIIALILIVGGTAKVGKNISLSGEGKNFNTTGLIREGRETAIALRQ